MALCAVVSSPITSGEYHHENGEHFLIIEHSLGNEGLFYCNVRLFLQGPHSQSLREIPSELWGVVIWGVVTWGVVTWGVVTWGVVT